MNKLACLIGVIRLILFIWRNRSKGWANILDELLEGRNEAVKSTGVIKNPND